jgi:orotate phosphoribosyltransferase
MADYTEYPSSEFIQFAIEKQVLRFGEFQTKAGRLSPYFFNAGLFNDGESLLRLGEFYRNAIQQSGLQFDMLFGPAYKGIPLVSSIVIAYAKTGHNLPYAFNRKEAKDHGEGGNIIGAPLKGRVLIVDDVISAGTSIRESVDLITSNGATACGVAISLDRQERGQANLSAVEEVEKCYGLPVCSIVNLGALIKYLQDQPGMAHNLLTISEYRHQYGTDS